MSSSRSNPPVVDTVKITDISPIPKSDIRKTAKKNKSEIPSRSPYKQEKQKRKLHIQNDSCKEVYKEQIIENWIGCSV